MNEITLQSKEQSQANLMELHRHLQEMAVCVKRSEERPRNYSRPHQERRPVMQSN
jgi:hypothetical protein